MTTSGPGPEGPGPDVRPRLEEARRRLYRPGGPSASAVAEYERLVASTAVRDLPGTGRAAATSDQVAPAGAVPRGRTRPAARRRRIGVIVGGLCAVALVVVLITASRPSLPRDVEVPDLAGTTLLGYGRSLDPATGPDSITYQPQGYTVFQPRGRTVAVALRCVGEGTVRISAGPQFDFRCTGHEEVFRQRDVGPRTEAFIVMGTTVGNVVWAARIVLLAPQQTSGAIPSFRGTCDSCTVVGTG